MTRTPQLAAAIADETHDQIAATTPSDWVDDRILAQRTPIARVTWQVMRRDEEGPPYYRVGRRCLYRWSEVVAWLESARVAPVSAPLPRRSPNRGK